MQPEVIVGVMSAGVGALAIVASTLTAFWSLKGQRDNTNATLETQRAMAEAQERALRDRSHEEELRSNRAPLYAYLLRWADSLLGALEEMTAEHSELPRPLWHIEPEMEDSLDLYSSDTVHIHFNSLRGLLIGLVAGSRFNDSPIVTWEEKNGRILNVSQTRTSPLTDWPARESIRNRARDSAIDLMHRIRGEVQGGEHSG
ncbi:MAG: hypothetical protein WAL41_02580, partial [Mycobacterium sp.]